MFPTIAKLTGGGDAMNWDFPASRLSPGTRLAAFVVLAHDPAVPAVAADWWEISGPHYRAVAHAVDDVAAGHPEVERALRRLAAAPADPDLERALAEALDRVLADSPARRSRLDGLVAEAMRHILIGYHRGPHAPRHTPPVDVAELRALPVRRPAPARRPRALVVIPFRDRVGGARARNLLACLASLRDQADPAPEITVTVVESDAEPRWRELIEPRADRYVFARHDGHFNKSWAVNVGVRQSAADAGHICVLDADVLVDDRFLERNLARVDRPDLAAFLPYRSMFCLDEPSSDAAIRSRCADGAPDVPLDAIRALVLREPPGACLWTKAETFHRIGGFDERYQGWGGEDDDVVARLSRAGRLARFDDPLLHLSHPRPQMVLDGRPFNAHIEPLSWSPGHGYGDLRGPAVSAR
jgi:hypothetical protein